MFSKIILLVQTLNKIKLEYLLVAQYIENKFALIFNPYPRFFGTITERVFWKKIQIHHWYTVTLQLGIRK